MRFKFCILAMTSFLVSSCTTKPLVREVLEKPTQPILVSTQETDKEGNNYVYAAIKPQNLLNQNISITFGDKIDTVGDAIKQLLSNSGYKLKICDPDKSKDILDSKLPYAQRSFSNATLKQILMTLVGHAFKIDVNPISRVISLDLISLNTPKSQSIKKLSTVDKATTKKIVKSPADEVKPAVDKLHQKEKGLTKTIDVKTGKKTIVLAKPKLTALQKYFRFKGYQHIISAPLIKKGTKAQINNADISKLYNSHKLYFSFNGKSKVVALAGTQKEADALASNPRKVFYALAGDTLKETIDRWAKISGFKLYYKTQKDFKIEAAAIFFGEFSEPNGALDKLMQSSSQLGVNIKAKTYSNNVLVIQDNTYSPILLGGSNE